MLGRGVAPSLHNRLFHARKYSAVWKRLADDTRRRGVVQECNSMDFVVRSSEVAVAVAEMETETRYAGSLHLVSPPASASAPPAPEARGTMCTHYILFQRARGNTQKAVMAQVDALERNMLLLLLKAEVARRCSLHVRDAVALAGLVCASGGHHGGQPPAGACHVGLRSSDVAGRRSLVRVGHDIMYVPLHCCFTVAGFFLLQVDVFV